MTREDSNFSILSEEMIVRYHQLSERAKEIDKELKELKKVLNVYFDEKSGKNEKGETVLGNYIIQRQIRNSERYDDEKTVSRLEAMNLSDCIQLMKMPDQQKIEAAITLGLLTEKDIEDCLVKKVSTAIVVRKV